MALVLPADTFRLLGEPRAVQRTPDSGRVHIRWLCPGCGSWVCTGRPDSPVSAVRNERAGRLDDTSWRRPTVHFWTRSKQPWIALPEGGRIFETQPDDLIGFLTAADKLHQSRGATGLPGRFSEGSLPRRLHGRTPG